MEREFWHTRWEEGRIGFHQDEINPYLQRYWPAMGVPAGTTVFVPLCGKSKDMIWLRDQGHSVIGVEIIPRAVEDFFDENGLSATCRTHDAFTVWQDQDFKIFQGDFFDITANDVAGIGVVYDRASLIALPPPLRRRYAEHLRTILPSRLKVLLVTMDYPQHEMDGPPFAVAEQEVTALYQDHFAIEQLCREDILAANPRFQQQGLSSLMEKVYILNVK